MPKKTKLSEDEEWLRLKERLRMLDLMEIPTRSHPKDGIRFDIENAMYKTDSGEIVSALNRYKKLIAVPRAIENDAEEIIYEGWRYEKYPMLKGSDFANHAVFCEYRVYAAKLISDFYLERAKWWAKKLVVAKTMIEFMKHRRTHKKIKEAAALKKALAELGGDENGES